MKRIELARGKHNANTVTIIIECSACGGDIEARSEFKKPNAYEEQQTHVFVEPCQECMKKAVDRAARSIELSMGIPPEAYQEACKHEHLNMDGICHSCGADCRGSN